MHRPLRGSKLLRLMQRRKARPIQICANSELHIAWYTMDAPKQGYVRFQEENGAKRALDGLSNKAEGGGSPQICGVNTELRVLEGRRLVS